MLSRQKSLRRRGRRFRRATARQVRLARVDGGPSGAVSLPVFPLASLLALAELLVARVALLAGGNTHHLLRASLVRLRLDGCPSPA